MLSNYTNFEHFIQSFIVTLVLIMTVIDVIEIQSVSKSLSNPSGRFSTIQAQNNRLRRLLDSYKKFPVYRHSLIRVGEYEILVCLKQSLKGRNSIRVLVR